MDPRLAYARDLEHRDAAVAARIEHVLALGRRADELRSSAETVEGELALLPERRTQLTAAAAEAERALARARSTLADAQREQAAATEERAAEERHARLVGRLAALEHDEKRLREDAGALGRVAAQIADELEREPRIASTAPVGGELAALKEWTARAHAAVLVARIGLESERDKIVREANELASSVLGEALQATSAASVRGRLERSLA